MRHRTTPRFWQYYQKLPDEVRRLADGKAQAGKDVRQQRPLRRIIIDDQQDGVGLGRRVNIRVHQSLLRRKKKKWADLAEAKWPLPYLLGRSGQGQVG